MFSLAFVPFAYVIHPIEEIDNAERDMYSQQADRLYHGALPKDAFHPLLYPLISAAVQIIVGDPFRAAQLVSATATIAAVWLTASIALRFISSSGTILALLLLILNFEFMKNGVLATSDMLFSALGLATVRAMIFYWDKRSIGRIVLAAFLFSACYFTRYAAIFLLPGIVFGTILVHRRSALLIARDLGCFTVAALAFLIPHFALTYVQFGSPLYNENWKNIPFKVLKADWSFFAQMPWENAHDMLKDMWKRIVVDAIDSFKDNFSVGLRDFLAPNAIARLWLYDLGFFVGTVAILVRRDWRLASLPFILVCYVLLLSITIFPNPRFLVPVAPIAYIIIAYAFIDLPSRLLSNSTKHYNFVVASAIVLGVAVEIPSQLRSFWLRHPFDEVAKLKELSNQHGPQFSVMWTDPSGWRHVTGQFTYLDDAYGYEKTDLSLYLDKIAKTAQEHGAGYLLYGALTMRSRPQELLNPKAAPPWLVPIEVNDHFVVYRIDLGLSGSEAEPGRALTHPY